MPRVSVPSVALIPNRAGVVFRLTQAAPGRMMKWLAIGLLAAGANAQCADIAPEGAPDGRVNVNGASKYVS